LTNIVDIPTKGAGWKQRFIQQTKKNLEGLEVSLTDKQWDFVADKWWEWQQVWSEEPIEFSGDTTKLKSDISERLALVLIAASSTLISVLNAGERPPTSP